jgi:hypothetical protein
VLSEEEVETHDELLSGLDLREDGREELVGCGGGEAGVGETCGGFDRARGDWFAHAFDTSE